MGLFGFLKKKKDELPLPPPPSPPDIPTILKGDIESIRPEMAEEYAPEMPEMHPMEEFAPERLLPAPAGEKEVMVFDRTVPREEFEAEPAPEVVRHMPVQPTFVAVEDYKRIINDTNVVRSKLMEAENFVRRLGDLKNEEERAFDKWRSQLEDVEKKLSYVDKLIAKAG